MSQADLMILALFNIQSRIPGPVCLSHLIVEAWKANKKKFGLQGWEEEYPDTNRAACVLSNRNGPLAREYMRRPFPKMFELTKSGWEYARRLDRMLRTC